MFERFTDRGRRVVVLAQEEARLLSHDYIGTEHLLLGLAHEGEGVAANALERLGVSLEAVRSEVEEVVGRGVSSPDTHIPFTARAKRALELALREAMQLGHNYIGPEHVLLGLVRQGEGVAAQVLAKLGAELGRVRAEVMDLLGQAPEEPPSGAEAPVDVARAVRVPPIAPLPAEMHPACPHCRTPLAEAGAVRVLAVPDVQAGHDVPARVVYCRVCGLGLGVLGV